MERLSKKQLVDYIGRINVSEYAARRNYLGGSTRISEYISRGVISLPQVRELILANNSTSEAYKLINELSWREYWHLVWKVRGNDIFEYIKPLPFTPRPGLPTAVLQANTGIKALDSGILQLMQTGYIDNHMRMWLAGLICNIAKCDWKTGANWMHSYLIDGDFASNHLSWQWVAGSYTGKQYLPQQDNINKYSETKQYDTYLDKPYDAIAVMEIPPELLEITTLIDFAVNLPKNTVKIEDLINESEILLYSPWTLDPDWLPESNSIRVLLIDTDMYGSNTYSQNVLDSIMWFANEIPRLKVICDVPQAFAKLHKQIIRKEYPGIANWPGKVEKTKLLYPQVPEKFYPSFSSFWKQTLSEQPTVDTQL